MTQNKSAILKNHEFGLINYRGKAKRIRLVYSFVRETEREIYEVHFLDKDDDIYLSGIYNSKNLPKKYVNEFEKLKNSK